MKKENKNINFLSFFAETKDVSDSVPSMAKKLRESRFFTSIPTWIEEIDISGAEASELPPQECLMRLNESRRSDIHLQHPAYALETLSMSNNVVVTPTKVTVMGKEERVIPVSRGVLTTDSEEEKIFSLTAAMTTTLVCMEVSLNATGASPVVWPEDNGMKTIDVRSIRRHFGCEKITSVTELRSDLYSAMMANKTANIGAHTSLSTKLTNFVEHLELTEDMRELSRREGLAKKDVEKIHAKIMVASKEKIRVTPQLDIVYKNFFQNSVARGGKSSSKGAISAGYFLFEMTRATAHRYCVVKDIMNVMRHGKFRILQLSTKNLGREELRWLVANGITVYAPYENFPEYENKPGVYSTLPKGAKQQGMVLTYLDFDDSKLMPEIVNDKVSYKSKDLVDSAIRVAKKASPMMAYMPLLHQVEEEGMKMFPCCDASNMRVMMTYGVGGGYKLEDLTRRAISAIFCRSKFARNRVPFNYYDKMDTFVKWGEPLIIPRLTAVRDGKLQSVAQFEQVEVDEGMVEIDLGYTKMKFKEQDQFSERVEEYEQYYSTLQLDDVDGITQLASDLAKMKNDEIEELSDMAIALWNDTSSFTRMERKLKSLNPELGQVIEQVEQVGVVENEEEEEQPIVVSSLGTRRNYGVGSEWEDN